MSKNIKLWWKTQILKRVVFNEQGKPVDCKGLQIKGEGKPFEEGTLYRISSEWGEYHYLGRGKYMSKRGISFRTDRKNPYYRVDIKRAMDVFGRGLDGEVIYG